MTTKEQERKALEQIKNILKTLDPDGYVNTAFEGVIEDAEENIENDFALSWKDRTETTLNNYKKAVDEMAKMTEEINKTTKAVETLKARTIEKKDLYILIDLTRQQKNRHDKEANTAAAEIVENAEAPTSEAFTNAVNRNRYYKNAAAKYDELENRLMNAANAF